MPSEYKLDRTSLTLRPYPSTLLLTPSGSSGSLPGTCILGGDDPLGPDFSLLLQVS